MKIEVSNGEIVDKYTILLIKKEEIKDSKKLANVEKELSEIEDISNSIVEKDSTYFNRLYNINKVLWKLEDDIRDKERKKEFDEDFISLARLIYVSNDERSKIKRDINESSNSDLLEEKSHDPY